MPVPKYKEAKRTASPKKARVAHSQEEAVEQAAAEHDVDVIPFPVSTCPIMGDWLEVLIERGSVREGKWGTELSLLLKFDDPKLPQTINGKTIFSKVSLNPKSKMMRDFCRFLHRRGILDFGEEYQKVSKDGSRGLMAERLKANLEDICGVWDPDSKELVDGKLAGHRVAVIVSSMVEWPPSSKFPNNYVHKVDIPEEANEGKSVLYSIFEISRLSSHVGTIYVGSETENQESPYYEDPDDEVPF